jgi:hypothetical protein
VATAGSGTVETTFDKSTNVLTWSVAYSGLSGPVTAGHVHGPAAAAEGAYRLASPSELPSVASGSGEAPMTLGISLPLCRSNLCGS